MYWVVFTKGSWISLILYLYPIITNMSPRLYAIVNLKMNHSIKDQFLLTATCFTKSTTFTLGVI